MRLRFVPMERRSLAALDHMTFLHEFAYARRPVLLTGIADGWPALRWSPSTLVDRVDTAEVVLVDVMGLTSTWTSTLAMGAFLRGEPTAGGRYLRDWRFLERNPALRCDYDVPAFFAHDVARLVGLDMRWVYIGDAGTRSATHVDVAGTSAWAVVTTGAKRWRVLPADRAHLVRRSDTWLDLFDLDGGNCAGDAAGWEVVQQPGELVWTPPDCPHAVENLAQTTALTCNYVDLSNIVDFYVGSLLPRSPSAAVAREGIEVLVDRATRRVADQRCRRLLLDHVQERLRSLPAP